MAGHDIVAAGYVSMDRIVKIRGGARVGYTSIVTNADNARIYYGGCPINVTYLLSRLGLSCLPLVRVGEDWVENGFRAFLEAGGVDLSGVEVVPGAATSNCYLIEDEEGQHMTLFHPGAQEARHFRPLDPRHFEDARLAVMTVGPTEDNLEFFRRVVAAGIPLAFGMKADFDAFPPGALASFLSYARIIFTNEGERAEIEARMGLASITDLLQVGQARVIVTTRGREGSVFYELRDGALHEEAVPIMKPRRVVDTTGSGDAYMAGFLYGYLTGRGPAESCRLGAALAASVIEAMGCCTGAPSLEDLTHRYQERS